MNWHASACHSRIEELIVDMDLDAISLVVLAARPGESTSRFFSNETLASGYGIYFPSDIIPAPFGGAELSGKKKAVAGFYDSAFQAVGYELGIHHCHENVPMEA